MRIIEIFTGEVVVEHGDIDEMLQRYSEKDGAYLMQHNGSLVGMAGREVWTLGMIAKWAEGVISTLNTSNKFKYKFTKDITPMFQLKRKNLPYVALGALSHEAIRLELADELWNLYVNGK